MHGLCTSEQKSKLAGHVTGWQAHGLAESATPGLLDPRCILYRLQMQHFIAYEAGHVQRKARMHSSSMLGACLVDSHKQISRGVQVAMMDIPL